MSPSRAAHRSLPVLPLLLAAALLGGAGAARAQIVPPKPGVPMPDAYYERLAQDRGAFRFKRAWKAQTERARRNRELRPLDGLLSGAAEGPEFRVEGTRRIPVLAGKFSNTGADPYTVSDLQQRLFDGPVSTGTVTDYYDEISYGLINLTGDVIGAQGGGLFQVSQTDAYYEGGCNGLCATANTGEFLKELLDGADPWVDFAQYDNDGPDGMANSGDDDGYVDFVAFVHPELGANAGEATSGPTAGSTRGGGAPPTPPQTPPPVGASSRSATTPSSLW